MVCAANRLADNRQSAWQGVRLSHETEAAQSFTDERGIWTLHHDITRLHANLCMSHRVSALSTILRSPASILGIVLILFFSVETAIMLVLPYLVPDYFGETGRAVLDAVLLTMVCAPALWWVIIRPLRRIAIQEHLRSETIVANAGESIITFDRDGSILSCNRAGTDLFGFDSETLIGGTIRRIIPELPLQFEKLPCEQGLSGLRAGDERFPVQVSVSEYPAETQEVRIAIIRDLTATELNAQAKITLVRETEALRAQQMATLAQLATGVAHEIRNPLTSIKMLIQVNRRKFADEGLPTDDLELVEQEIRRMERSVNSLLDFARPEKSEFSTFAIEDVIRRTVQLIEGRCASQQVRLAVDSPGEPTWMVGDAAQIQQLLLNLALNSLDAMPRGGLLEISTAIIDASIEVTVSDSGAGIDPKVIDSIFTPFVTTKPNGVGLGLGICRRIAEGHGGTLRGTNRASGGAQFRLTLPITHGTASHNRNLDPNELSCKAC